MDRWLYFDATHGPMQYCNPMSPSVARELEAVLDLHPGTRVLDIACGHARMLLDMAERYGIRGVGVDLSPYAFERARAALASREGQLDVELVHGRGEDVRPDPDHPFDVVMCIGASWIWKGWEGTLDALRGLVRPGGLVVAGEPYWRQEPPAAYLESEGLRLDGFPSLDGYAEGIWRRGLRLVWMRGASEQEWDGYEMQQAASFDAFARANPDHPDLEAIRREHVKAKGAYLRWGRACLGFAIWVIRA